MTGRKVACFIVRNVFTHDARNERMARALVAEGFAVTVIAPLLDRSLPRAEERDGYQVERIDPVGAAYRLARSAGTDTSPGGSSRERNSFRAAFRRVAGPAGRTFYAIRFAREAGARAAALHPSLYQADHPNALAAAVLATRSHPAPILYDSQELHAHQNVAGATWARRLAVEWTERRGTKRAASIITVNESIAGELAARYRIPRPRVVLNVPDVLPPAGGINVPEPLRAGGVKLLYVGGVTHGRGIVQAIDALRHLPEASLVIMGPSVAPFDRPVRLAAAAPDVAARVAFVPPVAPHHVVSVAARATIGLVTIENVSRSYYLSLPNKLFESLQAGLPVIVSDFPEMRRIVDQHGVGVCCDPSDPRSIAGAVRAVLDDLDGFRERVGRAAPAYTWTSERTKYLAAVAEALSTRGDYS